MDRYRVYFSVAVLAASGCAAGCGGASEAGPRMKPTPPNRELRFLAESAANVPTRIHKEIPEPR